MKKISYITTCKNRLSHLQQTLPTLVEQPHHEIIVVDYNCPEHTGDWVEQHLPSVKVLRVTDDSGWCCPRARNQGASIATGDYLCFVDADIVVQPGWADWWQDNLHALFHYRAAPINGERVKDTWGTVMVPTFFFRAIRGYDEAFSGWGGEDGDLYERLQNAGCPERQYPGQLVTALAHEDSERLTYSPVSSMECQHTINASYRKAKRVLLALQWPHPHLDLETRNLLYAEATKRVLSWADENNTEPFELSLQFAMEITLPSGLAVKQNCMLSLKSEGTENAVG